MIVCLSWNLWFHTLVALSRQLAIVAISSLLAPQAVLVYADESRVTTFGTVFWHMPVMGLNLTSSLALNVELSWWGKGRIKWWGNCLI